MLLRPILTRIQKYQRFAGFCIFKNVDPLLASPENEISSNESKEKAYVISYLVNSCGLSPKNAISASKKLHFNGSDKPDAVLKFLEKQGFSKTQIAELVRRKPLVLASDPKKLLLPKIEFLVQFTKLSEADIRKIFSTHPNMLSRRLQNGLAPAYHYLTDVIGAEKVETLLKRGSWVFNVDPLKRLAPNVDFLMSLGVPNPFIKSSLFHYPCLYLPEHDEFKKAVEEVIRMGFDPTKSVFILAVNARTGKGRLALWDQCYQAYSKWGWSKEDIFVAFRKHPNCMLLSMNKLSTVMDFLVNKMGRESRSLAKSPNVLLLSMEKRIVPRCSVIKLLLSKGLVKKNWSLGSVLSPRETAFLERYVTRYMEKLPQLGDIYRKARVEEV